MTDDTVDRTDERSPGRGRRDVLLRTAGIIGVPIGVGTGVYRVDRSYTDDAGDGIPDSKQRSESFHRYLERVFGADQFDGLDPRRKDLLLDVRYVGQTTISPGTKNRIEELFRDNGIYLQWLDYPERYDRDWFEREYGNRAEDILVTPRSFYHEHVDDDLQDVALQLVVVPQDATLRSRKLLQFFWAVPPDQTHEFSGMSVGNRAVVTDRRSTDGEARLVLHEIGHLALCHDDDPANVGVMGPTRGRETVDFMPFEWERLRTNLDAIRDTTSYDVALRRCLWEGFVDPVFDRT